MLKVFFKCPFLLTDRKYINFNFILYQYYCTPHPRKIDDIYPNHSDHYNTFCVIEQSCLEWKVSLCCTRIYHLITKFPFCPWGACPQTHLFLFSHISNISQHLLESPIAVMFSYISNILQHLLESLIGDMFSHISNILQHLLESPIAVRCKL